MPLNAKALEQLEMDLAVARGNVVAGQISSDVSDDAKMVAAAIVQAGAQIALAVASQE
jgi:hypothetical protein